MIQCWYMCPVDGGGEMAIKFFFFCKTGHQVYELQREKEREREREREKKRKKESFVVYGLAQQRNINMHVSIVYILNRPFQTQQYTFGFRKEVQFLVIINIRS